jgi:hypothetical protein
LHGCGQRALASAGGTDKVLRPKMSSEGTDMLIKRHGSAYQLRAECKTLTP